MGSAETTADMESPKRYCCHCICYFYVADRLTDADCFDFADFMLRYKDLQKSADVVEFDWVPRGFGCRKLQEQLGTTITSSVM